MGTCFSKKKSSYSPSPPPHLPPSTACAYGHVVVDDPINKNKPKSASEAAEPAELKLKVKKPAGQKQEEEEDQETQVQVKKEVFVIKHRKSHDERGDKESKKTPPPQNQTQPDLPLQQPSLSDGFAAASPPQIATTTTKPSSTCDELVDSVDKVAKRVRTQSCNKEELDAILIQCGRLSRSNSSGNNRKYSGSKRSYDFDANDGHVSVNDICHDGDADVDGGEGDEKTHRHRQSSRSRPSSPSSQGRRRRRTPSRERNQQQQQQQRSSSRERRTSRSPSKRSSSQQNASSSTSSNANPNNANANPRPGKMVSVPAAAISSLADKTNNVNNNNGEAAAASVKRISAKRNVGSPRCQSPARANARGAAPNEGQQPSLSRSSSRKAEHSPYRRNPLAEIDPNSLAYPQAHNTNRAKREIQAEEDIVVKEPNNLLNQAPMQKPTLETNNNRIVPQGVNYIASSTSAIDNNKAMSANFSLYEWQQNILMEDAKGHPQGKPQTLTRSRSSRRSRDLDIDFETTTPPSNPAPSLYTSLLLKDIQNFHQQNTTTNVVSLPSCVTKANSILEAVADLNSATKSTPTDQTNKKDTPGPGYNCSLGANYNLVGKSIADQPKDPFVESEVVVKDDLMEPSFHKYVTVKRGTGALEGGILDMEDQESSGSNSFVSGTCHSQQHHWGLSSSSWEPNSADSTDCWTSRSNTREEGHNHKKTPLSSDMDEAARRRPNGRKRDSDDHHQRSSGIGRGRLGVTNTKGHHTIPGVAAAASM